MIDITLCVLVAITSVAFCYVACTCMTLVRLLCSGFMVFNFKKLLAFEFYTRGELVVFFSPFVHLPLVEWFECIVCVLTSVCLCEYQL